MTIKEKSLAEIMVYLKNKGYNLENMIVNWDHEKRIFKIYNKEKINTLK